MAPGPWPPSQPLSGLLSSSCSHMTCFSVPQVCQPCMTLAQADAPSQHSIPPQGHCFFQLQGSTTASQKHSLTNTPPTAPRRCLPGGLTASLAVCVRVRASVCMCVRACTSTYLALSSVPCPGSGANCLRASTVPIWQPLCSQHFAWSWDTQ